MPHAVMFVTALKLSIELGQDLKKKNKKKQEVHVKIK